MNKIKLAAVTLTAAALLVPLSTTPAQAATYRTVCNSEWSWENIRAYNTHISPNYSKTIIPGGCTSSARDDGGWLRVDVDPAGNVDVNSWIKRHMGGAWSGCYVGEKHDSDPFSDTYGTGYWNFQTSNCTVG